MSKSTQPQAEPVIPKWCDYAIVNRRTGKRLEYFAFEELIEIFAPMRFDRIEPGNEHFEGARIKCKRFFKKHLTGTVY